MNRELKALLSGSNKEGEVQVTDGRSLRPRLNLDLNKKVETHSKVKSKVGMSKKEIDVITEEHKETIPSILVTPAETPSTESSSRQVIMAASTSTTVDADPMLKDLPLEQKTYISNLIAAQSRAVTNIRVVQTNESINIPYYDRDKMTAKTFFDKCQVYFRSQGFEEDLYHEYVGLILKRDQKIWYDSVKHTIATWRGF